MALLPPRPLLIDPAAAAALARRALFAYALFFLVGGGFTAALVVLGRTLLDERALWARGVPGEIVDLDGRVTARSKLGVTLSYEYEIDATYRDRDGKEHRGQAEFDYFWSPLDEDVEPSLRYDPNDPARFVLRAQAEGGLPRWGFAILCGILAALMWLALFLAVRNEQRRRRIQALVAEDGEEVLAELVSAVEVNGTYNISYRLPETGTKRTEALAVPPLVVAGSPDQVVLLRSPRDPDRPLLVRFDLKPFAIDPDALTAIQTKAQEGKW